MIFNILYVCGVFIIILLISFSINKKFVLNLLIILEGLILISIVFSFYFLGCIENKTILILILTFAACEAALGLSMLISFIRIRRNSYIKSLSINSWFLFSLIKNFDLSNQRWCTSIKYFSWKSS